MKFSDLHFEEHHLVPEIQRAKYSPPENPDFLFLIIEEIFEDNQYEIMTPDGGIHRNLTSQEIENLINSWIL